MSNDNNASEDHNLQSNVDEHAEDGRMFTQEEVNRIIKQRLAKVKETNMATEEEISKKVDEAVAARTAELDAKEQLINCRQYLIEKRYPKELLNALDTSDFDNFKQKADSLVSVFAGVGRSAPFGSVEARLDAKGGALDHAFNSNQKHTPKKWPPEYTD